MKYRFKFFLAIVGYLLFWFLMFYPYIVPLMNDYNVHPLIATVIFEVTFYFGMVLLSMFLLGEEHSKHSFKIAFVFFALYHIWDAVEPPFVLDSLGGVTLSPTAIISWDYGFGYTFHQLFGWGWKFIYYFVNIVYPTLLGLISVLLVKPQILKKITKKMF